MKLDRSVAKRVLDVVDAGLINGIGEPTPGKMCVEAAVCYAMGLPHGDDPPCVGAAVRALKIPLNDAGWSSNQARAKGMRQVAIAQLGSKDINQKAFSAYVAEQTIRRILPLALRAAAKLGVNFAESLEAAAVRCENEGTEAAADAAACAAADAADAACAAAADAAAADAAACAACAAAYAAYAADAACAAAYAADAACAADEVLSLAATIAVEALVKLGSEGAQWLDLCNEVAA